MGGYQDYSSILVMCVTHIEMSYSIVGLTDITDFESINPIAMVSGTIFSEFSCEYTTMFVVDSSNVTRTIKCGTATIIIDAKMVQYTSLAMLHGEFNQSEYYIIIISPGMAIVAGKEDGINNTI